MPEGISVSELSLDELLSVCEAAELRIRQFISSQVPLNLIDDLDVQVSVEGSHPSSIDIEVAVTLSPLLRDSDAARLVEDAIEQGFQSAEEKAKEILNCRSKR